MTSAINATKPSGPIAYTADVRANFSTAASEITALQANTTGAPFLPIAGGTLTGALQLNADPSGALNAATKQYVDAHAGSGGPYLPIDSTRAVPTVSHDMVPARHLSNLAGKTSAVIAIIGDSTATAGPVQSSVTGGATVGNAVDATQLVWSMLCDKLKADNPQITSWSFQNFGIGSTTENGPPMTGTALSVTLPPWFTNPASTWLSYVQTAAPDVLFWMFGTNQATSGITAGSAGASAAQFIQNSFSIIDGWTYVPNIVIVTNKPANPANEFPGGLPSSDDANQFCRKAQGSWHRTFALSCAAGYTSFPNSKAKGFGLVDLGRYFVSRVDGHDPASQGLQACPQYLTNTGVLGLGGVTGVDSSTMAYTTHGDFRLTFVLPGAGGSYLNGLGGNFIYVSAGGFSGNYLRFNYDSSGNITPIYVQTGSQLPPAITGTPVATTNGTDIVFTISMAGPRVEVTINGTVAMDTSAARFVSEMYGGTPINVGFFAAPSATTPIHITEFYQGIGARTLQTMTYTEAYGTATQGDSTHAGYPGGNAYNHQTSTSAAMDREVINALNFSVSGGATGSFPGNVTVSGGALIMNNATQNLVQMRNTSGGAPTFTTRSAGTRITLSDGVITGVATEEAIGSAANIMWLGVRNTNYQFNFYQDTRAMMTFGGTTQQLRIGLAGTHSYLNFVPGATPTTPSVISSNAGGNGVTFNMKIGFNNITPPAYPTGWAAATGTATRTTFVTSSVTLSVLAEHVKALMDDLLSYGLIGP